MGTLLLALWLGLAPASAQVDVAGPTEAVPAAPAPESASAAAPAPATATASATAPASDAAAAADAAAAPAAAADAAPAAAPDPAPDPDVDVSDAVASSLPFTLAGWVEAFYSWNFNEPSNGITNLRGFDNRHNSFQIANIVVDLHWDWENLVGRIMLQWGLTPSTYYLAEPLRSVVGSGVGDSSLYLWQWIQEANIGYRLPIGSGLLVEAGLFISPVGPEGMAVHSDFLFSRSDLFYGLPFYHTGIRVSYALDDTLTLMAWGINGWNSVLDANDEKSFALELVWTPTDAVTAIFVYMSGIERPTGAPERQRTGSDPLPWRHLFDANIVATLFDGLELIGQANAGFEPNRIGLSYWAAGALSLRVSPIEWLSASARGDFFYEGVPTNGTETATPIFWNGAAWVSSVTVGVDVHPEDHFSFRVEYRHDEAERPVYYRGAVMQDAAGAWLGNSGSQDTLTFGTTAWF